MSTHRWIALAILLALVPIVPIAGANSDEDGPPPQCMQIVTAENANGLHPVLQLSDQIAVGLETTVPTSVAAVLVIIPSLCNVPSPWDVIGNLEHTSSGHRANSAPPIHEMPWLSDLP